MDDRVLTVESPGGETFEVSATPARRLSLTNAGPWRWWATLSGDRSWWVTVRNWDVGGVPVVRERWRDRHAADVRANELLNAVRQGIISRRPVWRRRAR